MRNLFCAVLALVTACSFVGCKSQDTAHSHSASPDADSTALETTQSQESLESEGMSDSDSSSEETSSEETSSEDGSLTWEDFPMPEQPTSDLLREDVDAFGHKIAYYTDGTWKDLGRVEPLDFTPRAAASRYGYTQLRLDRDVAAGKQNLYNQFFDATLAFDQTGGDVAAEIVDGKPFYPIAKIDCSGYGMSYESQQEVWRTFRQDCPEFYFISAQFCTVGDEFWLCIDGEYAKRADRDALRTAIQNAALDCDRYLNDLMSDVEFALTISDYLTANVTYSYESDGVTPEDETWAHNLVGWATRGAGVCETYAESYAYLCDLFGLECWTVTGTDLQTGVGHAWNILQLDGVWYNVDVTWNDGFEKNAPQFIDRKWFCMGAEEFALTHQIDSSEADGLAYQVPLPALSKTGLNPVRLQENGQWDALVPTMDEAIGKMANEGSMYEIILYPDTRAQAEAGKIVYPQGASFTKKRIPKTAGLTITAKRYMVSETTYIPAILNGPETVELQGDVTLKDLTWIGGNINASNADLILTDGVELNLDSLTGAMICVDTQSGYAVLNGKLQVQQVESISGILRVNGEAEIELLQMQKDTALYHLTADNITVKSVITEEGAMLYATGKTSSSIVSIGSIIGESPFTVRLDFVGMSGYPTVKLTGALLNGLNFILGGKVSTTDRTEITPDTMSAVIANVLAEVDITRLRVYFLQGNTAYECAYTKAENGNLTVNP